MGILGVNFIFIFMLVTATYKTPNLLNQYKDNDPVLYIGVHVGKWLY